MHILISFIIDFKFRMSASAYCIHFYANTYWSSISATSIPTHECLSPSNFTSLLNYNDLAGRPTLFNGDYNTLLNKPPLFDGDYNKLTNKPKESNNEIMIWFLVVWCVVITIILLMMMFYLFQQSKQKKSQVSTKSNMNASR